MIRLLWTISVRSRRYLRHYIPTNILLDTIRTRRGLKWGVPAMLLAIPYLIAASILSIWAANGGPGWVNLLVLLSGWNALKFFAFGPISLVLLRHARVSESTKRRGHADEAAPILSTDRLYALGGNPGFTPPS